MDDVNNKLETFVSRCLPECIEKVENIQGGMINYTFRLHVKSELPSILSNNLSDNSLLTTIHRVKPRSIIVKIAYPYMVALGEDAGHLPLNRQATEARILQMFHNLSFQVEVMKSKQIDLSSILYRNKTIRISHVWCYSEIDNVLVVEDFGSLPNIEQYFLFEKRTLSIKSTSDVPQTYGKQLGNFVLDMQVCSLSCVDHLNFLLHDPEIKQIYWTGFISTIDALRDVHELTDIDELVSIVNRYAEDDVSRLPTDMQVLAHSDIYAGNVLVNEHNKTLAIIDWEFAAIRSPAFDIALFIARSHIYTATDPLYEPMISLTNAFMNAYRHAAKHREVSWYKNEHDQYLFAWSLGITYAVILMDWASLEKCGSPQHEIYCHRCDIVKEAANYLRRCRLGPEKDTYDLISHDKFLGRLFLVDDGNIQC